MSWYLVIGLTLICTFSSPKNVHAYARANLFSALSNNNSEINNLDLEKFESFNLRSRKDNLEMKKKKFCQGNFCYKKITKQILEESLWNLSGSVGVYFLTSSVMNSQTQNSQYILASTLTAGLTKAVTDIIRSVREGKLSLSEGLQELHKELVTETSEFITYLPEDRRSRIEALDNFIFQALANKQTEMTLKALKRREEVYLALPIAAKNASHANSSGNPEIREQIDHEVEKLIQSYPDSNREILKVAIQNIRDNSVIRSPDRFQVYLYGPHGTGKTTFVRRLGKALGLHICEIKLSDLESADLVGPNHQDNYFSEDDEKNLGKFGKCFREAGHINPIIFMDEAGEFMSDLGSSAGFDLNHMKKQLLQSELKKILDPQTKSLQLNGLGIELDLSRATIIFAGNLPLTDPALLSRVPQIVFGKLGKTEKRVAAQNQLDNELSKTSEMFNQEMVNQIRITVLNKLDFILAEDDLRSDGARNLQGVIKELVSYIRMLKQLEAQTGNIEITDEKLNDFILKSFKSRELLDSDLTQTPTPTQTKKQWSILRKK